MDIHQSLTLAIIDIFEDILEEKDISLPDPYREGNEGEARIFGETYVELELAIRKLLSNVCVNRRTYMDWSGNIHEVLLDAEVRRDR